MAKVIKVENLSKAYQLGNFGTGTISRDLERTWARIRGKEDPYLKIGEINDYAIKGESDVVWSLKDLNFDIEQGDSVGIIGRNGAGKSTLLKILSRVTSPTTGSVKIKGRIASLLEVGTGFHPELSGRENIYLNGAILGMRKNEIKRKFDEIVDFSGIERYIDTPVKRYSSGMYVRLAFAVAAHLESEILIIDEVLAVGDAEFQKKCLGKMDDMSKGDGRTLLFVSHNMGAIKSLCNHSILLKNGQIVETGKTATVINKYLDSAKKQNTNSINWVKRKGNRKIEFLDIGLYDVEGKPRFEFFMGDGIIIKIKVLFNEKTTRAEIGINIKNNFDELFTHLTNFDDEFAISGDKGETAEYVITTNEIFFTPDTYTLDLALVWDNDLYDQLESCLSFDLIESEKIKRGSFPGHVKVFTPSTWKKNII
ncbi:MAG: ABC transporter ATP-binding protein [Mucilaginibacter sp.]